MPFLTLKRKLAEQVSNVLGSPFNTDEVLNTLGTPPDLQLGHIALPCFGFAKRLGKSSNELATELADALTAKGLTCKTTGPYLNVRWNAADLYQETLSRIEQQKDRYGEDTIGNGKTVVIEYCSPNIAKKLAFHHIRSSLIGNVLANCYAFQGYQTERLNFVGDWGAQFSRLLAAFDTWGKKELINPEDITGSMAHLFDIYVRFHKEVENNESLQQKATDSLKRLEARDPAIIKIWEQIREVSRLAMAQTLSRLSVDFDHQEGESHYLAAIEQSLESFKQRAHAEESEGAWIVRLDGIKTPALIQKSDGTTLYLTRDIAAALDRFERFKFEKMYYVVSQQQSLHFQQLFAVLKKMGCAWADQCEHISFGTVRFGAEKMSTREGKVILLDDILDEAQRLALKVCIEKNPDLTNKEEVAEKVGVGAIIFGELAAHKQRDIDFNWDHVLALDGETGPYVQYASVRCQSLLKKASKKGYTGLDLSTPVGELGAEEEVLLLHLAKFRLTIQQVIQENEPFYLARYLIDLAKHFNRFYYQRPVLQASDVQLRTLRLNLVSATKQVLDNGMKLLGVESPAEM